MEIIILLICISVFIAFAFLAIFYWSFKSGQYDDTYTPSIRMLFDDNIRKVVNSKLNSDSKKTSATK